MKWALAAVALSLLRAQAECTLPNPAGATSTDWGQCGGQGWTGATICPVGWQCVYSNPYYSQCLQCTSTTTTIPPVTSTTPVTTTSSPPTSTTGVATNGPAKNWFVFGDSYTQTQFNYTSTQPSVGNPFGNPPYPGYTACGSYVNWIDLTTEKYNTSLTFTYNFAYGGATINATLVAPYEPTVLSLIDQVNQFTSGYSSGSGRALWTSSNSLFATFIGINDIGNSYGDGGNRSAFSETLLANYFSEMQILYSTGARNFLFLTVPPVDRSPLMLAEPASAQATEKSVILDFNARLATHAASFAGANTGVKTWVYDTNPEINMLLNSPTTYGFVDNTSYGTATGDMWCNNYHISPGVHDYVAQGVHSTLAGTGFI